MAKKYTFEATIQVNDGGGAFVFFPYDVFKEFGVKGRVPVKVTYDGEPYTGSMIKYGDPRHMLVILKSIRKKIGKQAGDEIEVTVERDETIRTVSVPDDFLSVLKKQKLLATFEKLAFTHQKEYVQWITSAKKEETRANRIVKSIEMLRKKG